MPKLKQIQYIGEICCTGPQVMNGYLGRKEDSEYALRKDSEGVNWYYTADIGCIDNEGYLHIKDRKRDMIKRKGHGVFPREVEDLIYMHEAVSEVGVIGVPDPETGQEIKAFISQKVLKEIVKNFTQKIPGALDTFIKSISKSTPVIIRDPLKISKSITSLAHPKDQKILASATMAKVDYFVTGNIKDFKINEIKKKTKIKVVTPKQAVKILKL